jgi:Uma2 family endonuclease
MTMLITDPATIDEIKAQRAESGSDQHDEVWDGVYVVSPLPNNEHQRLVLRLSAIFLEVVASDRLGEAFAGVNVSDRRAGWKENYRQPDVAVFLEGTTARDMKTHWLGGPDFAVEILSKGDRAREKLDFYAKVHVRELLLIDRSPWRLELYRLTRRRLRPSGTSTAKAGEILGSKALPLSFRLVAARPRPTIEVVHADGRRWDI